MDIKNITKQVVEISRQAGNYIRETSEKFDYTDAEKKGRNDYVSYVDKNAEVLIVDKLKPIIKGAGFMVEENTIEYKGEYYKWIIDPLDGTTNFIHGFFPYAVSIALMDKDEIVLGVIYEIGLDECFYAYKGGGAFLNGKPIKVSDKTEFSEALISTGFPYDRKENTEGYLNLFKFFLDNTQGIRRHGSAAVDMAYVACGRFDAFYECSLYPWDVAAGIIIVKEAGGKICDFKGGDNYLFNKEMATSNHHIFDEFKRNVVKFMNE